MPFDVDTSSYPRAAPQANALDIAGKLGGLQSQALGIDKQKLDLYNQHFQIMNNELANLANDPNTTKEEVLTRMHRIGDMFNMPAPVRQQMEAEFASAPAKVPLGKDGSGNPILSRTLDLVIKRGMDVQQKINAQYGQNGTVQDNATITPSKQFLRGGPVPSGAPIAIQQPPTQIEVGANQQPQYRGSQPPQLPPNKLPVQGGFPGQYQDTSPIVPNVVKTIPIVENGPRGGSAALAPGVGEAAKAVGAGSGEALAQELDAARNYQREIFPLQQAIPALEKLGTKGTGPGTETINHLKSFVLSNVPGVKESDFKGNVGDYDKANKYLIDFVNSTGNIGTNDKLAAAFAGNPSVGISNAAAVDVAKSALALRHMRQAQLLEFKKTGLTPDKFTNWAADWNTNHDPRAFGVNLLSPENAKKLKVELLKPGHEKERENFERSLETAKAFGLIKKPE